MLERLTPWLSILAALLICGAVIHQAQTILDQRIEIHQLIQQHHGAVRLPLPLRERSL